MFDLSGKVALVTGGSRGIGKEIAIKLATFGADIAINYTSNEDLAKDLQNQIQSLDRKCNIYKCDVSNLEEVTQMVCDIVKEFGKIDILINNAGITKDALLIRMKEDDFDRVIDVNLKGTFNCIKSASKYMMKKRYGKIINMASVVGVIGNAGQANYCASKAGIIGLTKSVARELATRNINVNAIAPGFIKTDMTDVLSDDLKEQMLSTIPKKEFGTPEDIANLAVFLASDMSNYITGQVINVDGGMVM
ncbi:MAG: 3-oxoacyl-[acyl-carrier-protein] reductase [Clostridioides sp.]|jgi:3-oxoacyl-[acyl-carrier protein] reductase|nr:3-oxoacyl-[acyl-carrier-protein] reductase [Clostridioides sp.]